MNKTELISAIAEKTGYTKKDVTAAVKALTDVIVTELENGGDVKLTGLGTFSVTDVAAREARNPLTGETVHVDAKKKPKFKASSTLKKVINGEE